MSDCLRVVQYSCVMFFLGVFLVLHVACCVLFLDILLCDYHCLCRVSQGLLC